MKRMTLIILLAITFISCKKFVEVPPPSNVLSAGFVFSADATAISAVTGIYSQMMNDGAQFCSAYTTLFSGLSADELYFYTPGTRDEFLRNEITIVNHPLLESGFWNPCYRYIYAANRILAGVSNSKDMTQATRDRVTGEAKFIRAFCYFHLVNFFGDVPLVLGTDYETNSHIPRSGTGSVYAQIVSDLKDAESLLSAGYPTANRARPNKYAAAALLARVYLYQKDWKNAELQAGLVINSGLYSLNTDLNTVFLSGSNETIWQLKPVVPSRNTWEGNLALPASNSSTPTYLLTPDLVSSFEAGDARKSAWVKSRSFASQTLYYPYKYKVKTGASLTEYYVVLRLAEQYLVRGEALAMQNNFTGALADITLIRARAGLSPVIASTQAELISAIEKERRTELFAEWGHRWFDLKRTGRADIVLRALKPATWQATDTLWPVPRTQVELNPLLTQNAGY